MFLGRTQQLSLQAVDSFALDPNRINDRLQTGACARMCGSILFRKRTSLPNNHLDVANQVATVCSKLLQSEFLPLRLENFRFASRRRFGLLDKEWMSINRQDG
jgi:hypothetical protein